MKRLKNVCEGQAFLKYFSRTIILRNICCPALTIQNLGYVTCKFSTQVEIHPGLNLTLPMVKALLMVTCWNELKFQPYSPTIKYHNNYFLLSKSLLLLLKLSLLLLQLTYNRLLGTRFFFEYVFLTGLFVT